MSQSPPYPTTNISLPTHQRWRRHFRWLGLVITALYWGALVAAETTRTSEEEGGELASSAAEAAVSSLGTGTGVDGARCVSKVDDVAFSVKWVAQLLNQAFQVLQVAFVPVA